jgi:hypothetical protein
MVAEVGAVACLTTAGLLAGVVLLVDDVVVELVVGLFPLLALEREVAVIRAVVLLAILLVVGVGRLDGIERTGTDLPDVDLVPILE